MLLLTLSGRWGGLEKPTLLLSRTGSVLKRSKLLEASNCQAAPLEKKQKAWLVSFFFLPSRTLDFNKLKRYPASLWRQDSMNVESCAFHIYAGFIRLHPYKSQSGMSGKEVGMTLILLLPSASGKGPPRWCFLLLWHPKQLHHQYLLVN